MKTTVQAALTAAIQKLVMSETARIDAEIILGYCLSKELSYLYTWPEAILSDEQLRCFNAYIERRWLGEPVAYITGYRDFWNQRLIVSENVLIPRPETELLVERSLKRLGPVEVLSVADLGTGTGAIAIAIASERPLCNITATDVSHANLSLACKNANVYNLENIHFILSNWLTSLKDKTFHVIISNPPYIVKNDIHLTTGDVRYEPEEALVSDENGLSDIRIIIRDSKRALKNGGWLLIEHGYDQSRDVQDIFKQYGYTGIGSYKDLNGWPRITEGQIYY
ncbi:MAG: peptide chain release factor N(5)-glutamine methyltransferase [Gammaproteobacteria bacterium]